MKINNSFHTTRTRFNHLKIRSRTYRPNRYSNKISGTLCNNLHKLFAKLNNRSKKLMLIQIIQITKIRVKITPRLKDKIMNLKHRKITQFYITMNKKI
jgi:hypothetical protein